MIEPANGNRKVLSSEQVVQIFSKKNSGEAKVSDIAKEFGVCSKTVRDIWSGRTWYRQTLPLDPGRPGSLERLQRRPGRPRGSHDKKIDSKSPQCIAFNSRVILKKESTMLKESSSDDSAGTGDEFDIREGFYQGQMRITSGADNFVDPFHDDWPYWSSVQPCIGELNAQINSTLAPKLNYNNHSRSMPSS